MDSIYLSEVIATRLSHDLIGNIGAVANAVELLNEGDEEDKKDIENILNFSSQVLSKRLKFFRLCFGLNNASVKTVEELEKITADYLSTLGNPNLKTQLVLKIETPKIYKFIMPAVMMMADTLVKGGTIEVIQNDLGIHIKALSDAPLNKTKLENIQQILSNLEVTDNPSTYAPLHYLMSYLEGAQAPLSLKENTLIIGE